MAVYSQNTRFPFSLRLTALFTAVLFTANLMTPPLSGAQAVLNLPAPGAIVAPTAIYQPAVIRGLSIYPDNPLEFDFLIQPGDEALEGEGLKRESEKLIKYFLAALTVPEEEMWVNLSPFEENRIISGSFGKTEMGRDMLAQDYLLKQLTASLMNPEDELGGRFWERVYARAERLYGSTDIPLNTFNKIWIVP